MKLSEGVEIVSPIEKKYHELIYSVNLQGPNEIHAALDNLEGAIEIARNKLNKILSGAPE